ncbi:MAG: response regulator [Burkholderiales bacterium]|nr:response regulator [Burkholderiales bacterium]
MQIGVDSVRAVENKRIFVVDGDEITRAVLQFMLHDENETHDLPSLDAALAKSVDWKPDLLILGIGIVSENGVGILESLKSMIQGLSILLVTDTERLPFAAACLKSGADDIVAKPLTIEIVRGKVDALLRGN